MKYKYITFDKYYDINFYNKTKVALNNNEINFVEYLSIKPPYHRYLKVSEKDLPKFINYDICPKNKERWLISTINARYNNESYYLRRKEGQDNQFEKYITPLELTELDQENRLIVFKGHSTSELRGLSSKTYEKIFKLTKNKEKGYSIFITFDTSIIKDIGKSNILMSFGDETDYGIYKNEKVPKYYELEYLLNYYIFKKEKIENKTLEMSYWLEGQYHPLKMN